MSAESSGSSAPGVAPWVRSTRRPVEGRTIVHVELTRSEKRNALTVDMLGALVSAVDAAACDDAVDAIVLSGLPGSCFCAGLDLRQCAADASILPKLLAGLSEAIRAMRRAPMPVVIAAHGKGGAIAGGCALLGGADMVVASSDLTLGYPVVRLGISPAVSAPFLVAGAGAGPARERMLDPNLTDAADAKRIGLVHEIVDDAPGGAAAGSRTIERALRLAAELGAKPRAGTRATKRLLNEVDGTSDAERIDRGLRASLAIVGNPEERERLAAMWS